MTSAVKVCFLLSVLTVALTNSVNNKREELEQYIKNKQLEINERYKPLYHVSPPVGWLNDPNGFSYFNGEYHLFYQFYPYDSVWGPMHWGHVSGPDLVNWKQLPTALLPDNEYCFSGSAVVLNNSLALIYTAHEDEPFVKQSQYIAFSENGVDFEKFHGNPVIESLNGSPDFRDPKAWRHGDFWYAIIGSKTDDNRGNVLLYRSADFISWEFVSVIGESNGDLGYMWECPDFFELDGKFVLLLSPQGIEEQGDRFRNLHQTGYIIGNFDYLTHTFTPETEFQELDLGHDFYAAQTTEANGKRYLVAWLGMWENEFPEAVDGWAGALTIVRELSLQNDRILMKPVDAMESLREENSTLVGDFFSNQELSFNKTAEIIVEGDLQMEIIISIEGNDGGDKAWLRWDPDVGQVSLTKESNNKTHIRLIQWDPIESKSWRIFLDASTLEWFCGEGEVVFSSRIYPDGAWKLTNLSNQTLALEAYSLKRSVLFSRGFSGKSLTKWYQLLLLGILVKYFYYFY